MLKTYVGYDGREVRAFDVAMKSAREFGLDPEPLFEDRLRKSGLLTRPVDTRGQMFDLNSGAPQATAFAISRFFVPLLAHSGFALFVDADVVFLQDPTQLLKFVDRRKAVSVVKHGPQPGGGVKMDHQVQTVYSRKNWSSVCLWNCDHPANQRLNLMMLNQWPGRDLHAFCWLADSEIGSLPDEWNWLVGVTPKPESPAIAHFTLGGPFTTGWEGAEHDDLWLKAEKKS